MTRYQIYCPSCGALNIVNSENEESHKCVGQNCRAKIFFKEQYHAGGYQVLVRYD